MPEIKERLKRRTEAAAYVTETFGIPCSPKTLAKIAVTGGGPAFRKVGRIPLYSALDLDEWARSRIGKRVRSTSELDGRVVGNDDRHRATSA